MMNDAIALPTIVNVFDQSRSESSLRSPPWPPAPPLPPGDVNVAVAPGPTPTIIFFAVPWLVLAVDPIHHRPLILISSLVASGVADLDLILVGIIDTGEGRVING